MQLKSLKLKNYRNYQDLKFHFTKPITILVGNNAQGKSNILEAIYFLATTKSLRAVEDVELINYEQEFAHVSGVVNIESGDATDLEIVMQKTGPSLSKRFKVNALPRRVIDYIGHLFVIAFSPEDINLVIGSPSLRRWHMDLTLAQIDREYKRALTQYGDIVTRKNKVLKRVRDGEGRAEEIDYWAQQQLIFGQIVSAKRGHFFDFLNQRPEEPAAKYQIKYQYLQSQLSPERLAEYRQREIYSATSLVGPHRDDFKFIAVNSLNQTRDLHLYGSRGEQRLASLDLKMGEVDYVALLTGERPILLLDDVFSELDAVHRQQVIALLPKQQTIMASVEVDPAISKIVKEVSLLFVNQGRLSAETD